MKRLIIGTACCLLAMVSAARGQNPTPPPPRWSPVLDCQARVFAIDTLICDDASLMSATRRLEKAFDGAMAKAGADAPRLEQEQELWSKKRNHCAFDKKAKRCVSRLQERRTQELLRLSNR